MWQRLCSAVLQPVRGPCCCLYSLCFSGLCHHSLLPVQAVQAPHEAQGLHGNPRAFLDTVLRSTLYDLSSMSPPPSPAPRSFSSRPASASSSFLIRFCGLGFIFGAECCANEIPTPRAGDPPRRPVACMAWGSLAANRVDTQQCVFVCEIHCPLAKPRAVDDGQQISIYMYYFRLYVLHVSTPYTHRIGVFPIMLCGWPQYVASQARASVCVSVRARLRSE